MGFVHFFAVSGSFIAANTVMARTARQSVAGSFYQFDSRAANIESISP